MNNYLYSDLFLLNKSIYELSDLRVDLFKYELESQEYGACAFTINNVPAIFRVAKITPTKVGQFVTLWKRIGNGPIMPYDISDFVQLFIILVKSENNFGQFIFPKNVLQEKGFVSQMGIGGKRAMRVYPPWDTPKNRQAQNTQSWQLLYFVQIKPVINIQKIKYLCQISSFK